MGDPKIVAAHMVELFVRYPQDRVDRAVVRLIEECEFIPRIAKIKQTLDEETADLKRQQEREQRVMLPAPELPPRPSRAEFDAKYRNADGSCPWHFPKEEKRDWTKAAEAKVRDLPGFDSIPDAPMRSWNKLEGI